MSRGSWARALATLACVLAPLAGVPAAHAALYSVVGELRFDLGSLNPIPIDADFTVNITTNELGQLDVVTIPESVFSTTALAVDIDLASVRPIEGLRASVRNGPGVFVLAGERHAGEMRLGGLAQLCLFADCSTMVPANISIPLGVVGASDETHVTGLVNLSVIGAPWASTAFGFGSRVHGPLSNSFTAAQTGGEVQLVTPIFIETDIAGAETIPSLAFLTFRIVPEPSATLLCGVAVTLLLGAGFRRRRDRAA